jgi:uncharacterized protein YceH (UPF0502 family)
MSMDSTPATVSGAEVPGAAAQRKWQPMNSIQRRIVGVLVEKAKTTPEQYPLTMNSLITGCNQKSNRDPQMNVDGERVETAIEELRRIGAVIELQSGGRVAKFKHCLYEWLGVDKVELAVVAELLLRGEQTVGELRGRAARMEPIADLSALKPVLQSLIQKGLVIELTPEGRGQVIAHALYRPQELDELKVRYRDAVVNSPNESEPAGARPSGGKSSAIDELRAEVAELRAEVEALRDQVAQLLGP